METSKNIYLGNSGIGAVKTDGQVSKDEHKRRIVFYSPARGAFLGLLRINVWGIASILAETAFEVDKATTDKQSAPNYWWDVQARWRNAWYNLGGSWGDFVAGVNKGKTRKPFLVAVAPKSIKNKLKAKGITGQQGIGDPATLTAIGAAAAIIGAITPLLLATINLISQKKASKQAGSDTLYVDEFGNPVTDFNVSTEGGGSGGDGSLFTDAGGNLTTAGYGTIGLSILALLFFGTMSKKK